MKYYIEPVYTQKSKRNAILRYVFMPEIMPRLRHIAQVMRRVFFIFPQMLSVAHLLPANHPSLNPATAHQNKVIDSFIAAWQNLRFKTENIPQISMFFIIFLAYFLLISLIIMGTLGLFFSFGSAQAQSYFSIPTNMTPYNQGSDWSFQMLSRIFGPDASNTFWGGSPGQNTGNVWYSAIFVGMMALYARALAFVAIIMILYILVSALSSAARSGRPFGEQFDSVWAPIRFGIAFGLMIPLGGSYNGGQLIVFQVSEMGINLANNVWLHALEEFENQDESLLRTAISDKSVKFMRDVFLINACYYGYGTLLREGDIDKSNGLMTDPQETRGFLGMSDMTTISYGNSKSPDYCGKVEVPTEIVKVPDGYLSFQPIGGGPAPSVDNYLPNVILSHFEMSARQFLPQSNGAAASSMGADVVPTIIKNAFCEKDKSFSELTCADGQLCNTKIKEWFIGSEGYWRNAYGWTENGGFFSSASYKEAEDLFTSWIISTLKRDSQYGWASAGVFYIRISAAMSSVENAINRLPRVVSLPINVSKLYATPEDQTVSNQEAIDRCGGINTGSTQICSQYKGSALLSSFLREANGWMVTAPKSDPALYSLLGGPNYDKILQLPDGDPPLTNNTSKSLFDLSQYIPILTINDISIHPLGQVMALGRTFLDISTGVFTAAAIAGAVGAFFGVSFLLSLASSFVTIAQILVVPGFFLLVAIPMMPFIYFTLAVIEWATAVVEAVIGMPLWILTFITSKGDLVGGAKGGIKILFEILLRPTIIVLSLLIGIIVFSAGVRFIGDSLELYMDAYGTNISDEGISFAGQLGAGIAFLFLYAFALYALALSCFKLITIIPTRFGRWGNLGTGFASGSFSEGVVGMMVLSSASVGQVTNIGASAAQGVMNFEKNNIDTKQKYDEWRKKEIGEVDEHNMEAAKYNSEIAEMNEKRRASGQEELKYRAYRTRPEEVSMRDVRRAHFANHRSGNKMSTFDYLKLTKSQGKLSSAFSNVAFASHMSSNIPGAGVSGDSSGAVPLGLLGAPTAPTSSWSDRLGGEYVDFEEVPNTNPTQGTMPSKEDIKASYSSMGLAAGATAADVKKQYKERFDQIKRDERKFKDPDADAKLKELLRHYMELKKHLGFED